MQATAYSYRRDPNVPPFDDSKPLVIFDGMCVLCSNGIRWMLDRDPNGMSRSSRIFCLKPSIDIMVLMPTPSIPSWF